MDRVEWIAAACGVFAVALVVATFVWLFSMAVAAQSYVDPSLTACKAKGGVFVYDRRYNAHCLRPSAVIF